MLHIKKLLISLLLDTKTCNGILTAVLAVLVGLVMIFGVFSILSKGAETNKLLVLTTSTLS